MALAIARAVALREEFLGWRGAGGRALVIDAEQGLKTIKRRLREAGLAECEAIDYVRVPDGLSLDSDAEHAAMVEALLADGDYALVLADPLYKLHSGDSNDERQAVELMKRFDAWRERYGFALLLPVHLRKPPQGAKFSIHEFFGSSAYQRRGGGRPPARARGLLAPLLLQGPRRRSADRGGLGAPLRPRAGLQTRSRRRKAEADGG